MSTVSRASLAAALLMTATTVNAADRGTVEATYRLEYLSVLDNRTLSLIECASAISYARVGLRRRDIKSDPHLVAVYNKAAKAALIKAVLGAVESGHRPKVKDVSFRSPETARLVSDDLRTHQDLALDRFVAMPVGRGLKVMSDCTEAGSVETAVSLGAWLDRDVAVLKGVDDLR